MSSLHNADVVHGPLYRESKTPDARLQKTSCNLLSRPGGLLAPKALAKSLKSAPITSSISRARFAIPKMKILAVLVCTLVLYFSDLVLAAPPLAAPPTTNIFNEGLNATSPFPGSALFSRPIVGHPYVSHFRFEPIRQGITEITVNKATPGICQ